MIERCYLEVTSDCNYRCAWCVHPRLKRPKRHIGWDLACEALRQIREHEIARNLYLNFIGEPLLYPRLFELVQRARRLGLPVHLITNGSLLDRERLEAIGAAGLASIKVSHVGSADGSVPPPEAASAGLTGLIRALRGTNTRVGVVLMTSLPDLPRGIPGLRTLCTAAELDRTVARVHALASQAVEVTPLEEVRRRLTDIDWRWWNAAIALNQTLFLEIRPMLDWGNALGPAGLVPATHGSCGALRDKVGILESGDVVPCCVDYEGEMTLGNLRERPLVEILESPLARRLRESFARQEVVLPKCATCLGTRGPQNS